MRVLRLPAVLGVCGVVAACTTTMSGTAQPADTRGPTSTTTTTPAPVLVPAAQAADKLLKRGELADIVGDTDMRETFSSTRPEQAMYLFDPSECGDRLIAGSGDVYGTMSAFVGNQNRGARGQTAIQVISIWVDRNLPRQTISAAALDWRICKDNQPFTANLPDALQHWTSGTVTVNEDTSRISTTSQRQEPPPHTCSHVMAAQANVVVDTAACGDGDTLAAANQIADRILAKIPQ